MIPIEVIILILCSLRLVVLKSPGRCTRTMSMCPREQHLDKRRIKTTPIRRTDPTVGAAILVQYQSWIQNPPHLENSNHKQPSSFNTSPYLSSIPLYCLDSWDSRKYTIQIVQSLNKSKSTVFRMEIPGWIYIPDANHMRITSGALWLPGNKSQGCLSNVDHRQGGRIEAKAWGW